jgi:hypothetical protein
MPFADILAERLADKIVAAAREDRSRGIPAVYESVRRSSVASSLKEINEELGRLIIPALQRPLTPSERSDVVLRIGKALGLRDPSKLDFLMKQASNDAFIELTEYWDRFFRELGL